jgi:PhnB protein
LDFSQREFDMPEQAQQGVTAHLCIAGAAEALEFYKKGLGATEMMRMPAEDGKRLMHAAMRVNGCQIFLMDEFPEYREECGGEVAAPPTLGGTAVVLHLDVPDCDAAIARMVAAGARVTMPAMDAFWGDRYGQVVDPFGHSWSFAHRLAKQA